MLHEETSLVDAGDIPWSRIVLDVVEVLVEPRVFESLAVVHAHANAAAYQTKFRAFDPWSTTSVLRLRETEGTHMSRWSHGLRARTGGRVPTSHP